MPTAIDTFQLQMGQASQWAMSATLFCMMLAVALGLKPSDFGFIRRQPRLFVAGFVGQVLALPALTLGLCFALEPQPAIALGMLLISCCPGGNVSNILVLFARGNTALSVSLTATSSVLAAFFTPLAILFWASLYPPTADMLKQIDLDVAAFLLQTAMVLALPLLIGMWLASRFSGLAQRVRQPLVVFSSVALGLIILVTLFKAGEFIITVGGAIVGVVALHNACANLVGYTLARLVGADVASRRAITFEIGIQNSGLGIVIIMSQFGGIGGTAAIAGLWGVWHILAGLGLLSLFRFADRLTSQANNSQSR